MTNDSQQIIRCQCSAKLRVPAAAVGRKVACPKCGFKILVGAPSGAGASPVAAPAAAPPPPPPSTEEDSLLDDLLSSETSSETAQGPDLAAHQKTCPKCKSQMTKDAKVCLTCGHDPAIIGKEPVKKSTAASKVGKLAVGTGRFGIGCALSAGGALLAAGLWYGVAMWTGYEIGYIAWGVGVLAGLGMRIGYGQENMRGAMAAMVMAAMGILAAKGLIYNEFKSAMGMFTKFGNTEVREVMMREQLRCESKHDANGLSPWSEERFDCVENGLRFLDMSEDEILESKEDVDHWYNQGRWNDADYAKTRLAYLFADENPAVAEINESDDLEGDGEVSLDWAPVLESAMKRVEELPADQWKSEIIDIETETFAELQRGLDAITQEVDDEVGDLFNPGEITFISMFGPIDAIFILLALGSAIKLGGGQED